MTTRITIAVVTMLVLSLTPSFAGAAFYNLKCTDLTNVDDAAGRWQHEGGQILKGGHEVGRYAAHCRVTWGGTNIQNTAMFTMTLFFYGTTPPENITVQGSHDYAYGGRIGSVSAASAKYARFRGGTFTGNTTWILLRQPASRSRVKTERDKPNAD